MTCQRSVGMQRSVRTKTRTPSAFSLFVAVFALLAAFAAPAMAQNPVPFIDQPLVPDAAVPGGPAFTLTVNGAGFVAASTVNWNGSPLATTFVSSAQLTATVPASDIATASAASVTVVNPSPGGGVSSPAFFEVATSESAETFGVSQYGVDSGPSSVAVADFNGVGALDLVVANLYSHTVSVLLGKGDGTFSPKVDYATGTYPVSVAVGDFNGDGKPDLAVAASGVSILMGNGDGTFQPYVQYATGNGPLSIATGDFNGDGKLDLVTANNNGNESGSVSVLLGNGDGTFQAPTDYPAGMGPWSVAVGDFRGNGILDLAVANYADGTISVLLGNGDGTFQPQVVYATGGQPISVAVGDFNGDGKPDLAVANFAGGTVGDTVGIFLGNGDGTFQPQVNYAAGQIPCAVVVGDFNGDDKLDLAVADDGSDSVSLLMGNGDGTFQTPADYAAGTGPQSLAAGDFNGDGRLDLAVGNYNFLNDSTVTTLLQTGPAGSPTSTALAPSLNPSTYGQVILTASVSASGTPTGTVMFYDGATSIGFATLAAGKGAISGSSLAAGSHSITATYEGSGTFAPSTSSVLTQIVNPASTTTALASSPNPVPLDKYVTYTATVVSQYGAAATGAVTFQDNGTTVATAWLSNNQASFTTKYKTAGVQLMAATYSGDSNNFVSTSSILMEDVGKIPYESKTTVTTSGSPSEVGQPVTFTATVRSSDGAIPDGELVTFYDDGTTIGTGTTVGGIVTFTTSSLTAKTHTIKATYAGDATFRTSSGRVTQVVDKYTTTTALVSSLNPSTYGQAVTFTATVTSGGPTPTGKVRFKDGATGIGSEILIAGVASLTKKNLAEGSHSITAEYEGDGYNATSDSPVLDQVVNPD